MPEYTFESRLTKPNMIINVDNQKIIIPGHVWESWCQLYKTCKIPTINAFHDAYAISLSSAVKVLDALIK